MGLSVVLTLAVWFSPFGAEIAWWLRFAGTWRNRPPDVIADLMRGQVWRLITPIFLHGSILHLLFNMWWLRDFGGMIESRRGTWFLLLLVLASALVGNAAQYVWAGPYFVGMSGVVYGLFGYIWMKSKYDPQSGLMIGSQTVTILIAWLLLGMVLPLGVANGGHLGGLAAGLIMGYAPVAWRRLRRRLR